MAVLRGMCSPRVDLSGFKKRTGGITLLREMYCPRYGSIRVEEKNSCFRCTERNVHPQVESLRAKRKEQVP
jgi:hypothetical protein